MRYPVFLVLSSGITAVIAQTASGFSSSSSSSSSGESSASNTETSPLLFQTNGDGDSTDFSVSVVGSTGPTTTYLVSCVEAGSINCNFDKATVIGGPSTVAMYYNYDDTVTYSLGCNIVESSSAAACVMSEGGSGLDGTSFLTSFAIPTSSIALGFITDAAASATATGTASAGASAATDRATSTTLTASARSSPTAPASVMSTTAPSGGTTSLTGSATGTGAASQASETKKSAAVGRFDGASCRWMAVGSVVVAALRLVL